jgi:LPXTG-motif cell wall-anchored protein
LTFYVQILGGRTVDGLLRVLPGPSIADPEAPRTTTPLAAPRPQASPRPANLADTGASVVELTALGALLLLAGAALLLVRQRDVS